MRTRPLTWHDLKVEISTRYTSLHEPRHPWKDRAGNTRVYASLKNASFVNHIFWLPNPILENPATQAMILLTLQKKLHDTLVALNQFSLPT